MTNPIVIKPVNIGWVRVDVDLPNHPKARLLAATLDETKAWAYVVELWMWCANHARDGRVPARLHRVLEETVGWRGARGALISALVEAGFCDRDGDALTVHHWMERQGKEIQRAVRDIERKRIRRTARPVPKGPTQQVDAEGAVRAAATDAARRDRGRETARPRSGNGATAVVDAGGTRRDRGAVDATLRDVTHLPLEGDDVPPPPSPAAPVLLLEVAKSPPGSTGATARECNEQRFYDWAQGERRAHLGFDVVPDEQWPRGKVRLRLAFVNEVNPSVLAEAYTLFLEDPHKRGMHPPCPMWSFVEDWPGYVSRVARETGGAA